MRNLLILILMACVGPLQAQNYVKAESATYIRRSAYIIQQAHKELFKLDSAKMEGKFAKAIGHQRMARSYFQVNDFKNAVYHSAYARRLAASVYFSYNPLPNNQLRDTPQEAKLASGGPSDKDLDKRLVDSNPGITFNDKDFITDSRLFKLDVDDLVQP
ncbi:MAG TPA: hypothetical protein VFV37_09605 [Luteibaculaceae bacterium]|nr:hypothetical protein [Luteibaculaceae bacterium]